MPGDGAIPEQVFVDIAPHFKDEAAVKRTEWAGRELEKASAYAKDADRILTEELRDAWDRGEITITNATTRKLVTELVEEKKRLDEKHNRAGEYFLKTWNEGLVRTINKEVSVQK